MGTLLDQILAGKVKNAHRGGRFQPKEGGGAVKVLITGGTGFIGRSLCRRWLAAGHDLTVLTRQPGAARQRLGNQLAVLEKLPGSPGSDHYDVVVNLAGAPIADRPWTQQRKRVLRDSRIQLTDNLLKALQALPRLPSLLISASAIGYYGNQGDQVLDETTEPHFELTASQFARDDFAHQLCCDWEAEAARAEQFGIRVCTLRLGLVVGQGGGIVQRMSLPFKLGLGGPLGSGQQWMSWVHREDVLGMIDYLVQHETLQGVFNATAPVPVTNEVFSKTLAAQYQRPCWLRVPALVLQLGLGEMSELLLGGQRVLPRRIQEAGYHFQYNTIDKALAEVCQSR